jgi:hypothetical protein
VKKRISTEQLIEKFRSVQLEPIDASGVYKNTRTKIKAKCELCGIVVERSLSSILSTGTNIGCQVCSKRQKTEKSRLTDEQARELFIRLGLNPIGPYPGSQIKWVATCNFCGRKVSRTYSALQDAIKTWGIKIACQYCNGNKVIDSEVQSLVVQFGLIPLEAYSNNSSPRLFKCQKCGAETRQTFINIRRKIRSGALSFGCPQCSFNESGRRKAETEENAEARFLDVGLRLIGKYENARKAIECECLKCGSITKQTLNGVKNGKTCKFCAQRGIQHGEPAYLYLIENSLHNSLKVGIGNIGNKNDRLTSHHRQGWSLIKRWDFNTGEEAEKIETIIFRWIRNEIGIPIHLSKGEMPQGGWSETFSQDSISMNRLIAKIEESF